MMISKLLPFLDYVSRVYTSVIDRRQGDEDDVYNMVDFFAPVCLKDLLLEFLLDMLDKIPLNQILQVEIQFFGVQGGYQDTKSTGLERSSDSFGGDSIIPNNKMNLICTINRSKQRNWHVDRNLKQTLYDEGGH